MLELMELGKERTSSRYHHPLQPSTIQRRKLLYIVSAILSVVAGSLLLINRRRSSTTWETLSVLSHSEYETILQTTLPEVGADLVMYRHRKTHTEVTTLVPYDSAQDSVFGISFRTLPSSSTGVAHILEHSVLSGSEKYPVKDPFNALLRGSLHTFLNAMTYPDRTVYPVASRNSVDFANLMSVYLDAVFKPRAVTTEGSWILRQEGWRIDQADDGNLEFKGVVMSEMKGAYSNPDDLMYQTIQSMLFPDTPYIHDSGGEPSTIPTLSRKEFVDFYHTFYHPNNAQLFLYGKVDDIREGLNQADGYFQRYDARPDIREASRVPWQQLSFDSPVRNRQPFPSSVDTGKRRVIVSWLLHDKVMDEKTTIAWYVLDHLLIGTSSSVLRKALLDTKLGDDVIGEGFDKSLLQAVFAIGMKGIANENDVPAVEAQIYTTLNQIVERGFNLDDVASSINTIEFMLRESQHGSDPKGITIFLKALSTWNYDQDPRAALQYETALRDLKTTIAESGSDFFVSLIQNNLLQNNHRAILELFPSSTLEGEQAEDEKQRLNKLKGEPQFNVLIAESKHLSLVQATEDTPQTLASIPSLQLEDLDRSGEEYPISIEKDVRGSGVTVLIHEVLTSSGIAYIDFGMDISKVALEDAYLIPLLSRLIIEVGRDESNGDIILARQIGMYTGGITEELVILPVRPNSISHQKVEVLDGSHLSSNLFLRGKCTADQAPELFKLYNTMLMEGTLDSKDKAVAILKEMTSGMEDNLVTSGHHAVIKRLKSRFNTHGFILEEIYGVSGLQKLKAALVTAAEDWESLLGKLEQIKDTISQGNRNGIVLNLTGDRAVLDAIEGSVVHFLDRQLPARVFTDRFPDFTVEEHPWVAPAKSRMSQLPVTAAEGIVVSSQVSYVGKGGILYQPGEQVHGSIAVATKYLERGYLFEQLRLKRGAYGAFASLGIQSGALVLVTYRDPNLGETLSVYENAAATLKDDISGANQLPIVAAEAVIGTIGSIDGSAPDPDTVGWHSLLQWIKNDTRELRQNWRNEILSTSLIDLNDFTDRLSSWGLSSIAVVSSNSAFEEAAYNGWDLELVTP